jgi:hypothetical protein
MTTTDGFGRPTVLATVYTDGHVGMTSSGPETDGNVEAMAKLLAAVGIPGWELKRIAIDDAVPAYLAGLDCPNCALVLPCGCSVMRVLADQCPHGQARRIHRIAHDLGYCSDGHPQHVGPPLDGAS